MFVYYVCKIFRRKMWTFLCPRIVVYDGVVVGFTEFSVLLFNDVEKCMVQGIKMDDFSSR